MDPDHAADPWVGVQTRSGLKADEVISALQKEIRRGHAENAALLAHEMIVTSPELEAMLWQRLKAISVEDVGWGELLAPVLIDTLDRFQRSIERGTGDRFLFAIHAVRYLSTRTKDRSSDELTAWVRRGEGDDGSLPAVPDYALDMHTDQGRRMGRGRRHFYEEGSRVSPELPDRDTTYRDRLLASLTEDEG
jgi:replication-associated recombination protein RarA